MRTTLNVADHLLIEARKVAADRRTTLTEIVEESLRAFLASERARPPAAKDLAIPVNREARPVPGVTLDDTSELLEIP
jgi:hypothetical protein